MIIEVPTSELRVGDIIYRYNNPDNLPWVKLTSPLVASGTEISYGQEYWIANRLNGTRYGLLIRAGDNSYIWEVERPDDTTPTHKVTCPNCTRLIPAAFATFTHLCKG